jgi:hypothetical protein
LRGTSCLLSSRDILKHRQQRCKLGAAPIEPSQRLLDFGALYQVALSSYARQVWPMRWPELEDAVVWEANLGDVARQLSTSLVACSVDSEPMHVLGSAYRWGAELVPKPLEHRGLRVEQPFPFAASVVGVQCTAGFGHSFIHFRWVDLQRRSGASSRLGD